MWEVQNKEQASSDNKVYRDPTVGTILVGYKGKKYHGTRWWRLASRSEAQGELEW